MDPEDLIDLESDTLDYGDDYPEGDDDGMSDVEADADTLRSAGMGTDEDYGHFGGEDDWLDGSYED